MLEDIHPNQQAKQAKIVAGFDSRIARLEQEIQALKALLLESQDFNRKLARRVDDLQSEPREPAQVIAMPAADPVAAAALQAELVSVVADMVAPPSPPEADPAPVVEAVAPDKKPAPAPKKTVPAKKKDGGNA